jgi:hypothetical protein
MVSSYKKRIYIGDKKYNPIYDSNTIIIKNDYRMEIVVEVIKNLYSPINRGL